MLLYVDELYLLRKKLTFLIILLATVFKGRGTQDYNGLTVICLDRTELVLPPDVRLNFDNCSFDILLFFAFLSSLLK